MGPSVATISLLVFPSARPTTTFHTADLALSSPDSRCFSEMPAASRVAPGRPEKGAGYGQAASQGKEKA